MEDTTSQALRRARELLDQDPEQALALYQRIIDVADGPLWAEAHVDLASYHYGHGEYEQAVDHANAVLSGPARLVTEASRARSGIMLNNAKDKRQQPIDEAQLRSSAEECIRTGQPYYAGAGLSILGRHRWLAGDREGARESLERAVELLDQAGSMYAGPGVLKRLAEYAIEQGDTERALRYIDRGIEHLRMFPLGGVSVRRLEQQLVDLRSRLS
jgi:tetratricopeptide (TPR) repeat protein